MFRKLRTVGILKPGATILLAAAAVGLVGWLFKMILVIVMLKIITLESTQMSIKLTLE